MFLLKRFPIKLFVIILSVQIVSIFYLVDFFRIDKIVSDRYLGPVMFSVGDRTLGSFTEREFIDRIKENNPRLAEVSIKKKYPGQLNITTKLREPLFIGTSRNEEEQYIGDKEGVIYKLKDEKENNLPTIITERISLKFGSKLDSAEEQLAIQVAIIAMNKDINLERIETTQKDVFAYIDGTKVVFQPDTKTDQKLRALHLLLKRFTIEGRVAELIDLRFDKPVIKYSL